MTEIWEDIEWFEGKYQVGNIGFVRSMNFNGTWKVKLLKWTPNKDGYLKVDLRQSWYRKSCSVHRLVAIAFIPNPENKPQVNHKYWIKDDNRASELEWDTSKENIKHSIKILWNNHLQKNHPTRWKFWKKHHNSKTILQFKDWKLIKEWGSGYEITRALGINRWNITNVLSGRYKQTCWFVFKIK